MSATLNSELRHRAEADLSSPALITDLVGLSVHAMKSQSQGSKPRVCGVGFPFWIAILAQPSSDRSSHWYGVRTTSAYQHLLSACMTARSARRCGSDSIMSRSMRTQAVEDSASRVRDERKRQSINALARASPAAAWVGAAGR
ncbi:hypothetical protein [Bradyrhizobium sp. CCBAU 11386]|uniref:hypothetical protein n=1 Tax=Bradyrhizobium sp. CCBAU 11386 TaxID=1630837 RepID=UPI0023035A4E|nr:hypothetical protein [Bradyrhizobium sp. CCBAU 11386]